MRHLLTTRARARAFTLSELVVAVGAAAILTASVGLLFRSVGDLSSNGIAAIQLDAAARVLERQLRDDFAAMSSLDAGETFLAIRFREVGDINRDNNVDPIEGERGIYLTLDDREADLDDELDAYTLNGDGVKIGRGITTRLDEMVFLAEGSYVSAQAFGGAKAAQSTHARIYYGHGLKPLPDPQFDYDDDDIDPNTGLPRRPVRQYVPDGDFGARPGDVFDFAPGTSVDQSGLIATGRNEYAADWSLARQAALLYGGNAPAAAPPIDEFSQTIGDRAYAPYIRDIELVDRWGFWNTDYTALVGVAVPLYGVAPDDEAANIAEPRYLQGGRVDIIAQDINDVRRWLEGERPVATGQPINYAGAYSAGFFVDNASTLGFITDPPAPAGFTINHPLWPRLVPTAAGQDVSAINLVGLQSAIAGVFTRPLLDNNVPQIVDRRYDPTVSGMEFRERPDFDLMDTHTLLATRCSRFEIAWTDGTTVVEANTGNDGLDVNGDAVADYRVGDLVWFDISPILDDDGDVIRRNTLADWVNSAERDFVRFGDPRFNTDSPVAIRTLGTYLFPEIIPDSVISDTTLAGVTPPARLLSFLYDHRLTGGAQLDSGGLGPEAYAIWGFREPLPDGSYGRPWAKPMFIRVRATLHDRELRNTQGRTYEFTFNIGSSAQ